MNLSTDLGSEVVTRLRAPQVADPVDGSLYRDWTTAAALDIPGCSVQPFLLSNKLVLEDNLQREFAGEFYRLYLPAGSDILPDDRIIWRGNTMDIYGFEGAWYDFEGNPSHVQALAYRRKG